MNIINTIVYQTAVKQNLNTYFKVYNIIHNTSFNSSNHSTYHTFNLIDQIA